MSGGSSSGSAVAVATGEADLALGTDTAGSGRVPAMFCGVVGLKPTPGWLSVRGVVPASPSYDCVSVFARDVATASLGIAVGPRRLDPRLAATRAPAPVHRCRRIGRRGRRRSCDPALAERLRRARAPPARARVRRGRRRSDAYLEAGQLLYGGGTRGRALRHRLAAPRPHLSDADPTVAKVIAAASGVTAHSWWRAQAPLGRAAPRVSKRVWTSVDAVLVPTAPRAPDPRRGGCRPDRGERGARPLHERLQPRWAGARPPSPSAPGAGPSVRGHAARRGRGRTARSGRPPPRRRPGALAAVDRAPARAVPPRRLRRPPRGPAPQPPAPRSRRHARRRTATAPPTGWSASPRSHPSPAWCACRGRGRRVARGRGVGARAMRRSERSSKRCPRRW